MGKFDEALIKALEDKDYAGANKLMESPGNTDMEAIQNARIAKPLIGQRIDDIIGNIENVLESKGF